MMEDVATAEISRSQVWQWVNNAVVLADTGEKVTASLVREIVATELADMKQTEGRWDEAARLFEQVALADEFVDFLTLPGYALL
jgi:malate synthase